MKCQRLSLIRQMSAWSLLLLTVTFGLSNSAHAQSTNAGARVWEAPLTIPTYELGPPDPNPPLFDPARTRRRPVYPYPLLDTLTNRKIDKSYNAVFLENEYLRVTVLPELGGKLYAIYDKTAGARSAVHQSRRQIRNGWDSRRVDQRRD